METISEKDYADLQAGRVKVVNDKGEVIGTIRGLQFTTENVEDNLHIEEKVLQFFKDQKEIDFQIFINAIKEARVIGGFYLKEAKEFVEFVLKKNGWKHGANKHGVIVWSKDNL